MPTICIHNPFRRLLVIAVLLFSYNNAIAENYLDYYQSIATAEADAVNGKYSEALQEYNSAFAGFAYNNPIDCYVAAQLAAYTGDTATCMSLIRRGHSFGLPLFTIRNNPHLAGYLQNNSNSKLSAATLDSCWNVYQGSINKKARATAIRFIQIDQALVRSLPPEALYQNGGRTLKPVYQPFYDSLLNEIIAITKTYGFPAQRIAGTLNGDDNLFTASPHSIFVYLILLHHCNAWPQLGDMLWTELQKGNITPLMYAAIFDYSSANISEDKRFLAVRPCDTKACKQQLKTRLEQLNAQRAEIGLCSYGVMEQKFASSLAFYKWRKNDSSTPKAVFDFQPDLHFRQ